MSFASIFLPSVMEAAVNPPCNLAIVYYTTGQYSNSIDFTTVFFKAMACSLKVKTDVVLCRGKTSFKATLSGKRQYFSLTINRKASTQPIRLQILCL